MIDGLIVTIQKLYGTNLVRLFLYINAVFRKKTTHFNKLDQDLSKKG